MKILQVSKSDLLGGAEAVAWTLFDAYRRLGHESWLAVGEKHRIDPDIKEIPPSTLRKPLQAIAKQTRRATRPGGIVERLASYAANPGALRRALLGQDSFRYAGSRKLLNLIPAKPDLVHCHNLHGSYFDLRELQKLGVTVPVVITMHDAWLLTGGCTHPLDCERWKRGCGHCPYRHLHFRASVVDSTAFNWRRKSRVLAQTRLHVITPSRWLMERVPESMLEKSVLSRRVIPNGVELSAFGPSDRAAARSVLGIDPNSCVIMHASAGTKRNASKDFATMRSAVILAAHASVRKLIFIVVGDTGPRESMPNAEIHFIPFIDEPSKIATYYGAADIYLQGSIADTFPGTVLEAMACALPVVATRVGGIPEQVIHGETGLLTQVGDVTEMANSLAQLVGKDDLRRAMGEAGMDRVRKHFSLKRQVDAHLNYYLEIMEQRSRDLESGK